MWSCIGIGMLIYQVFIYLSLLVIESTGWFGKSLSDNSAQYVPSEASKSAAQRVFSKPDLLYQIESEALKGSRANRRLG